jgi:translation initiation factor 3 subunit C
LQKEKETKEAKKKMNSTQAKALNSMKNKIKKIVRQFEDEIEKWRQVNIIISIFYYKSNFKF